MIFRTIIWFGFQPIQIWNILLFNSFSDGGKRFFGFISLFIFTLKPERFFVVLRVSFKRVFNSNNMLKTPIFRSFVYSWFITFLSIELFEVYYLWSMRIHMLWSSETYKIVIICLWFFFIIFCCYYDLSRVLSFFLLAALLWLWNYEISTIYLNTYLH